MRSTMQAIAAAAAPLVVEEGLDYASAKHRALKLLGLPPRTSLPENSLIEEEVRTHLALFHGDTQPGELAALRRLALVWMERLAPFRPHICGAVWNGTATRQSDIHLQLFCDDPKSAEVELLDRGIPFQTHTTQGLKGELVDTLSISSPCPELSEAVDIHLTIHDHDDLRGALRPAGDGQARRGDHRALTGRLACEVVT